MRRRLHYTLPTLALLLSACVEKNSLGSLDTATTSDGSSGSSAVADVADDTGAPDDTGATDDPGEPLPADCPAPQPSGTLLWEVDLLEWLLPQGLRGYNEAPIQRLSDGRLVVGMALSVDPAENTSGVVEVSPTGEILGLVHAAVPGSPTVEAFAVDASDHRYTLGEGSEHPRFGHYGADGALIVEADIDFLSTSIWTVPLVLTLADTPVVAGVDEATQTAKLGKLDPDTGATIWSATLVGETTPLPRALVVAPGGDIIVAGEALGDGQPTTLVHLWRFTGAGVVQWHRAISVPQFAEITDLQFAPGGDLLLLRGGPDLQANLETPGVQLMALAAADGSPLWDRTIAAAKDGKQPWSEGFHIEGDTITVPVTWTEWDQHEVAAFDRVLTLHSVSLTGDLLATDVLVDPAPGYGSAETQTVPGRCGELVVLMAEDYGIPLRAYAR